MPSEYRRLYRLCRLLLLATVTLTVVWTATDRFAPPIADRYIGMLPPGAADLYVPWAAGRALIEGRNPYLTPLQDPWARKEIIDGRTFYFLYPPAIITLYLPLSYYTADFLEAGTIARVWHFLALLALAGIAWLFIRSIRRSVTTQETEPALFFLLFVNLAICAQTSLALERAQSDITVAVMCWTAAWLIVQGHTFWAIFIASAATLAKAYPIVFTAGLGLMGLLTQRWRRALAAPAVAAAVFLLPVRNYLQEGFDAARFRANMQCHEWRNYAFSQFWYQHFPDSEWAKHWGPASLTLLCCACAFVCLVQALRATPQGRSRWVVMFTSLSLTAMVAYSACGYMYSFVIIAPGLLVLLACAPELLMALGFSPLSAISLAALQALPAFWLFAVRGEDPLYSKTADGLVLLIALIGVALSYFLLQRGLRRWVRGAA